MNKAYDYKTLLHIYIEAQRPRPSWADEEARHYYPRLLAHLETAFGIKLSLDGQSDFDKKVLFMLFQSTALSCKDLGHPWSNFVEATLLIRKLEEEGEIGQRILAVSDEIREVTKTSEQLHLKMLYDLFECIYDPIDTIVTSEQLMEMGFDDSKEPNVWDFE